MPFGLKNMEATYQCLINKLFEPLIGKTMEVYVDDMIVKSKADVDHDHDLRKTFDIFLAFSMKLNPKKYVFGVRSGKFSGFMISSHRIEANSDMIRAVLDMKPLQNVRDVQRLIGFIAALAGSCPNLRTSASRSSVSYGRGQTSLGTGRLTRPSKR